MKKHSLVSLILSLVFVLLTSCTNSSASVSTTETTVASQGLHANPAASSSSSAPIRSTTSSSTAVRSASSSNSFSSKWPGTSVLSGEVTDITMGQIYLETANGTELSFVYDGADTNYFKDYRDYPSVDIYYKGIITGTDTSNSTVIAIVTTS